MRITEDKNGDPFGYCEANCGQQLRIGGDKRRVRDFFNRYPAMQRRADNQGEQTANDATSAPPMEIPPVTLPQPAKKPKAEPRSAMADALRMLGAM